MAAYYYVIASLPHLIFQGKPPLQYPDFMALCTPWLDTGDLGQLELARIDVEAISLERASNDLLKRWIAFEGTLRNELVKRRAKNLRVPEEEHIRVDMGFDAGTIRLVGRAIQDPSPYRVELNLLEIRWDFLTQNEVGHYFDLTALIIYSLKLQLLERMQSFHEEKGQRVLELLYEQNNHERRKHRNNHGHKG
jgi:hypothetical protein